LKTQHTPKPWKALHLGGNKWEIVAASPHVKGMAQTIAELNGPWKPENYTANARLISAAPELLEALQYMLRNAEADGWSEMLCKPARTAIAKAEGRTP
jgi:hypothetical protein